PFRTRRRFPPSWLEQVTVACGTAAPDWTGNGHGLAARCRDRPPRHRWPPRAEPLPVPPCDPPPGARRPDRRRRLRGAEPVADAIRGTGAEGVRRGGGARGAIR